MINLEGSKMYHYGLKYLHMDNLIDFFNDTIMGPISCYNQKNDAVNETLVLNRIHA